MECFGMQVQIIDTTRSFQHLEDMRLNSVACLQSCGSVLLRGHSIPVAYDTAHPQCHACASFWTRQPAEDYRTAPQLVVGLHVQVACRASGAVCEEADCSGRVAQSEGG